MKATAQMGGLMFEEWCKELAAVVGPSLFVLDGEFRLRMSMDLEAFYKRIYESKEQPWEWISVSERLPERGVVLAVTADREIDLYQWNLVADYANDPDPNARITHWMPLPPPPERP